MLNMNLSLTRNAVYNIHESYISVGLSVSIGMMMIMVYLRINEVEFVAIVGSRISLTMVIGQLFLLLIIAFYNFNWKFNKFYLWSLIVVIAFVGVSGGYAILGLIVIWIYALSWLNDLWLETFSKFTLKEMNMILTAMKWLIFSEFMLFVGCFWAVINFRLLSIGLYFIAFFPLFSFNALSIPFSNLMILLFSTLPCQSLLLFIKIGLLEYALDGIAQTILCGVLFISLQSLEFLFSLYSISDLIVGSIFYFTTSIHGLHVIIGSIGWLIILFNGLESYIPSSALHFPASPSFFLALALSPFLWSYYWHFVDFIWLIVFLLLVS